MALEDVVVGVSNNVPSDKQEKSNWLRQKHFEDPGPPPDGGWIAWRQVLGGFCVVFACWGFINSFGLFQTYYTSQAHISSSPSAVSWIGSIQIFLLMCIGAYSGSASDSGYFRLTTIFGMSLFVFGVFMTSICHEYYQFLLAHGVCTGLGMGFMFIPVMSVNATYVSPPHRYLSVEADLSKWSARHKSLALGSMLCGASVGGMVLPVMFNNLIPLIGFGWSMRIFGFIAMMLFSAAQLLLKKRLPPKDSSQILEFEVLKDGVFDLFVVGSFVNFLGLYVPFFFIGSYARNVLGLSFARSNLLLLAINGTGIPGRLIPMWLADQRQWKGFRPITIQIPMSFVASMLLFSWAGVKTEKSAYIFAAFYGFFANAVQSLFPATLADMTLDHRKTGAQIGWAFTLTSFACLTGNPIGGRLVSLGEGRYLYAQIYAAVCTLVGCALIAVVALLRFRQERALRTGS